MDFFPDFLKKMEMSYNFLESAQLISTIPGQDKREYEFYEVLLHRVTG